MNLLLRYSDSYAFPHREEESEDVSGGMTLLEYYAGQALAGILSDHDHGSLERVASDAVQAAKCLVKELHEA